MLGSEISAPSAPRVVPVAGERPRKGLFRRRTTNRRVAVQRRSALVLIADLVAALGRRLFRVLRLLAKVLLVLGTVAAIAWGGRLGVLHVLSSPRFALRDVQVDPTEHVGRDELVALAGVAEGDRLLAIDTDAVAARLAAHPWVASARVRRQLPSVLRIEVTERRAAALVTLGALYLVDEEGRPFKRASMEEAEGLPVVTGVERDRYLAHKEAAEGAFRQALAVLRTYRARPGRPAISEINVDPRFGFTLFLLEGGGEVRLGRGDYGEKLARFDRILEALKTSGQAAAGDLRVVHLDGAGTRIPVRLAERD